MHILIIEDEIRIAKRIERMTKEFFLKHFAKYHFSSVII